MNIDAKTLGWLALFVGVAALALTIKHAMTLTPPAHSPRTPAAADDASATV